jgi:uncharacterized membrane protein
VPTLLILSASLAWWFTEPKNARINLIAAAGAALFCWAVAPELCRHLSYSAYALAVDAVAALRLDLVILRHAKMLVTGVAVVWYVKLCRVLLRPSNWHWHWQQAHSAILQAGSESVADALETGPRAHQHPGRRCPRSARRVACRDPSRCRHRKLDALAREPVRPKVPDPGQRGGR